MAGKGLIDRCFLNGRHKSGVSFPSDTRAMLKSSKKDANRPHQSRTQSLLTSYCASSTKTKGSGKDWS